MSMMKEFRGDAARCSAAMRRSSRTSTRATWRSGAVGRRLAGLLRLRCAAASQDVAHAPIVDSFVQLAKNRRLAAPMVDAAAMHKQVLVLQLISAYRTLGMRQANLDPLKRAGAPDMPSWNHELWPHRRRHRHRVQRRFVQGRLARSDRMRLRDPDSRIAGDLLRHHRRRVHVHQRHCAEALDPGPPRAACAPGRATRRQISRHILERLTAAETLERYLHTSYVGQKRFSPKAAKR